MFSDDFIGCLIAEEVVADLSDVLDYEVSDVLDLFARTTEVIWRSTPRWSFMCSSRRSDYDASTWAGKIQRWGVTII